MKKFFALAVLFAAVTMVSCGGQNKKAKDAEQAATECCAEEAVCEDACCAEKAECQDACCAEKKECCGTEKCADCPEKKECCKDECCAEEAECKDACCGECEK
jgi:hypothetical protein